MKTWLKARGGLIKMEKFSKTKFWDSFYLESLISEFMIEMNFVMKLLSSLIV
jgi:hypothetical protein